MEQKHILSQIPASFLPAGGTQKVMAEAGGGCIVAVYEGVSAEAYRAQLQESGFLVTEAFVCGYPYFTASKGEQSLRFYRDGELLRLVYGKGIRGVLSSPSLAVQTPRLIVSGTSDRIAYVQLDDGSFVVFDGAFLTAPTKEKHMELHNELRSFSGTECIHVAAWFITHAHSDHCQLLETLHDCGMAQYYRIDRILYQFPPAETIREGQWDHPAYFQTMEEKLALFTDAEKVRMHTGDVYELASFRFEVLVSPEDMLPCVFSGGMNETSVVIRQSRGAHSILWTGDMATREGNLAEARYGKNLKCSVLQIPHHGFGGGNFSFYELCAPEAELYANTRHAFFEGFPNLGYGKTPLAAEVYDLPCCKKHIFGGEKQALEIN